MSRCFQHFEFKLMLLGCFTLLHRKLFQLSLHLLSGEIGCVKQLARAFLIQHHCQFPVLIQNLSLILKIYLSFGLVRELFCLNLIKKVAILSLHAGTSQIVNSNRVWTQPWRVLSFRTDKIVIHGSIKHRVVHVVSQPRQIVANSIIRLRYGHGNRRQPSLEQFKSCLIGQNVNLIKILRVQIILPQLSPLLLLRNTLQPLFPIGVPLELKKSISDLPQLLRLR